MKRIRFGEPLWVDLLAGRATAMDRALWEVNEEGTAFSRLPVYDSPVLVADSSGLRGALNRTGTDESSAR